MTKSVSVATTILGSMLAVLLLAPNKARGGQAPLLGTCPSALPAVLTTLAAPFGFGGPFTFSMSLLNASGPAPRPANAAQACPAPGGGGSSTGAFISQYLASDGSCVAAFTEMVAAPQPTVVGCRYLYTDASGQHSAVVELQCDGADPNVTFSSPVLVTVTPFGATGGLQYAFAGVTSLVCHRRPHPGPQVLVASQCTDAACTDCANYTLPQDACVPAGGGANGVHSDIFSCSGSGPAALVSVASFPQSDACGGVRVVSTVPTGFCVPAAQGDEYAAAMYFCEEPPTMAAEGVAQLAPRRRPARRV